EFIEEILAPPFGGMITFVKESEALMEKGQLDKLKNDEGKELNLNTVCVKVLHLYLTDPQVLGI
ncbi:vacuolar protein sorting-associated protein 52 homolog, partial [Tachysurus ichikawai]